MLTLKTFIIRVDASESIGLGHLSRCLLIADYLNKNGFTIVFFTAQLLSQKIVESKGFECKRIDSLIPNPEKLYKKFSVLADINSKAIFKNNMEYFRYLRNLSRFAELFITIEDLIDYPYCADMVIIPYCGANKLKLKKDCNTSYLLGPSYFPLKNEFNIDSFLVSKNAKKILITMGGSDPTKITLKVVRSINKLNKNYEIIVIIGRASNITNQDIDNEISKYNGNYKVLRSVDDMAKLMLSCDIAVTNSGLTKYELSALGVPSIIISNNEQHAMYSDYFSRYESTIHLGSIDAVTNKNIEECCYNLMQDYKLRLKMSKNGKSLVDCEGLQRVGNAIHNLKKNMDHYAKD